MQPSRQLTKAWGSLSALPGKRSVYNKCKFNGGHTFSFRLLRLRLLRIHLFCAPLASRFALDSFCMRMCCGMSTHKSSICLDVLQNFSLPVTVRGRVRAREREREGASSLWQPGSRKEGKGRVRRKDLLFLPFKFSLEPSFA